MIAADPHHAALVVPCYNEERRLDLEQLGALAAAGICLVLVDDGSSDGTAAVLRTFVEAHAGVVLSMPNNMGKAEAVRRGLLQAIEAGASVVGYADADFATPATEIVRLLGTASPADVIIGARVALAGRVIERRTSRHYVGRVIATVVSAATGLSVYDTQCGAKFFRVNTALCQALAIPFSTRWLFDVELLLRVDAGSENQLVVWEEPLLTWRDVPGSHLEMREFWNVVSDLARLRHLRTAGSC